MRSILNALHEGRLFELPATDKTRALEFLARILDANPDIEVGTDAIEVIQERERECNTGLGAGIAVPHIRAKLEEGELFCAIGWSQAGIEYGAPDGKPVHLVFMYYIPAAQKNVYLKEVSSLVRAIKNSGGSAPVASTDDLNAVRNLLLDWVSTGMGVTGPEAVARMIKLEVKQAESIPVAAAIAAPGAPAFPLPKTARLSSFAVLVVPPASALVLADDTNFSANLEKDGLLSQRLAAGIPFAAAGRQVFVTGSKTYPAGRILYNCVAIAFAS